MVWSFFEEVFCVFRGSVDKVIVSLLYRLMFRHVLAIWGRIHMVFNGDGLPPSSYLFLLVTRFYCGGFRPLEFSLSYTHREETSHFRHVKLV